MGIIEFYQSKVNKTQPNLTFRSNGVFGMLKDAKNRINLADQFRQIDYST